MSQRDSGYERKERDLYETPEWVTEALLPHIPSYVKAIWEPAAGSGRMERVLDRVGSVIGTDIDRGHDFLSPPSIFPDAIITNPPYDQAQQFIERAIEHADFVAMLLRTDYDHAKSRAHLFRDCRVFSKKVVLLKRIVWFVEDNGKPKASPSFNHAWYIWDKQDHGARPIIQYAG